MAEGSDRKNPADRGYQTRKARGKKDRKRWCRGKVGREHQWQRIQKNSRECKSFPWWKHLTYSVTRVRCWEFDQCAACGKEKRIPDRECKLVGDRSHDGILHPYLQR
jgi:hypothetical protein